MHHYKVKMRVRVPHVPIAEAPVVVVEVKAAHARAAEAAAEAILKREYPEAFAIYAAVRPRKVKAA